MEDLKKLQITVELNNNIMLCKIAGNMVDEFPVCLRQSIDSLLIMKSKWDKDVQTVTNKYPQVWAQHKLECGKIEA